MAKIGWDPQEAEELLDLAGESEVCLQEMWAWLRHRFHVSGAW